MKIKKENIDLSIGFNRTGGYNRQVYKESINSYIPDFSSPLINNVKKWDVVVNGKIISTSNDNGWGIENATITKGDVTIRGNTIKITENIKPNSSIGIKFSVDIIKKDNGRIIEKYNKTDYIEIKCEKVNEITTPPKFNSSLEIAKGLTAISIFNLPLGRHTKLPCRSILKKNGVQVDNAFNIGVNKSKDNIIDGFTSNYDLQFASYKFGTKVIDCNRLKHNNIIGHYCKEIGSSFANDFRQKINSIYEANKNQTFDVSRPVTGYNKYWINTGTNPFLDFNIEFDDYNKDEMYCLKFKCKIENNQKVGDVQFGFANTFNNQYYFVDMNEVLVIPNSNLTDSIIDIEIPIYINNKFMSAPHRNNSGKRNFGLRVNTTGPRTQYAIWDVQIVKVAVDSSVIATEIDRFIKSYPITKDGGIYDETILTLFTPTFITGCAIKTQSGDHRYIIGDEITVRDNREYILVPTINSSQTGLIIEYINDVSLENFFNISWYKKTNSGDVKVGSGLRYTYRPADYGSEIYCVLEPYYLTN